MGTEQQQSTGDDIECSQRDRLTEAGDYRTIDLLNRAAEIKSELRENIDKLWEGLDGHIAKDSPAINNESESVGGHIPVKQSASESTRTAKKQGRTR